MLRVIGAKSIDDLYVDVPKSARRKKLVDLPKAQGELAVERRLRAMAEKNAPAGRTAFFIGAGAYRHHVPASVDHLIQRSEFLTTYTPYQPEIAQGTLQALYEFQTQVAMLAGMEVANASMYDGSTACAEAALMAARVTRRRRVVFSGGVHPHYLATARTFCDPQGIEVVAAAPAVDGEAAILDLMGDADAAVVVQSPNVFGTISDLAPIAAAAHGEGALLIATFTEAMAFGLVEPPGSMDADIVAGEGQSFGNALSYGGPYVGVFATREKFVRQMPGRLAGETVDAEGRRGYVLTLATREQHIRREKATSNICTNAGLCTMAFTIHLALLGSKGLERLARLNHETACKLKDVLENTDGVEVLTPRFFNEFAIRTPKPAAMLVDALAKRGVLGGVAYSRLAPGMDDVLLVCATETNTDEDIARYATSLEEAMR
jgi:glycine dehydrogenase subunit 1